MSGLVQSSATETAVITCTARKTVPAGRECEGKSLDLFIQNKFRGGRIV
jgi:hypothetical protein